MRTLGWPRTLAVTALVAVACSSGHPAATGPAAASGARLQSPCPAVQPVPQFPAATPSNRNLVLGRLRGSDRLVVRDITDITHPTSVLLSTDGSNPQFATSTDVSFVQGSTFLRMPSTGSPITVAAPCHGLYATSFAWSADGSAAAYVTNGESQGQLRLVRDGQDHAISSMPTLVPTHGCVYRVCADRADIRLLFSPNGAYISFVQNLGGPSLHVWSSDGKVFQTIDSESATMSVWSGSTLYFRDDAGVQMWRDGAQSLLLAGVAWIRPKASPAGGQIVYATRDGSSVAHVDVLDTSTGKPREIAKWRSEPVFLNSHLIWYQEERPCVPADLPPCGASVTTTETGTTYIYDLQDSTETESRIAFVADIWPHPA